MEMNLGIRFFHWASLLIDDLFLIHTISQDSLCGYSKSFQKLYTSGS